MYLWERCVIIGEHKYKVDGDGDYDYHYDRFSNKWWWSLIIDHHHHDPWMREYLDLQCIWNSVFCQLTVFALLFSWWWWWKKCWWSKLLAIYWWWIWPIWRYHKCVGYQYYQWSLIMMICWRWTRSCWGWGWLQLLEFNKWPRNSGGTLRQKETKRRQTES